MEIQKIFTDLYDDERIYSVLMNENELYLFSEIQKEFNDKKKKNRKSLERIESKKGLGRTILSAPFTNGGSIAGYLIDDYANDLDKKGLSDHEILNKTKSEGLKRGAIIGGGIGAATGLLGGPANAIKAGVTGAALGALGGRNAAGVKTRDRLRKRKNGYGDDIF